ncbi:MAG: RIP metalloprotease RseP [Pseudomonadota bacterium]
MPASIIYMLPAFIVVLSIVVFIHEMGHYLAGRWCGVGVKAFSIGFGKELFGWNDRHGTRWKVCLIPLGGYVKFAGDMNAASAPNPDLDPSLSEAEKAQLFQTKPLWARAFIVVAGPIANFLLAIVIFSALFWSNGRFVVDPIVTSVIEGGAAEEAGVEPGDIVVAIDGQAVSTFTDLQRYVSIRAEIPVVVSVDRDGEILQLPVTPRTFDTEDGFGNPIRYGLLGVRSEPTADQRRQITYGPIAALGQGISETGFTMSRTLTFLGEVITGRQDVQQLGGPVRIARMSGQVATLGVTALITFVALLSVSIGLLNLFPVPVLDGGHLMFYAIEAVRGKPLGPRATELAYAAGLMCVLGLMLFVTSNDVLFYGRQLAAHFFG